MTSSNVIVYTLLFAVMFACTREQSLVPGRGNVSFSLQQKDRQGGRVSAIAEPAFVLLSVEDNQGAKLHENKKIALFSFGGSYTTESIEFSSGSYVLTKFMVLDANEKVIYATPLENSDIAYLVNDPLPIHFTVSDNSNTKLVAQVLAVAEADQTEAFGYLSFGFSVVTPIEMVKLKTNVKLKIGEILYENVDAKIVVTGFDASNQKKWSQEYNYTGPNDNELLVKGGYDHYLIEMFKWGMYDKQQLTGVQLWKDRADGAMPVTYVLGGTAPAKKLKWTIEEKEMPAGNGDTYMIIDSKTEYEYGANGMLKKTTEFIYSSTKDKFEPSGVTKSFSYQDGRVSKIVKYLGNDVLSEYTYYYTPDNNVAKITEKASGHTSEVNVSYNSNDKTVKASYTYSSGPGFEYQFFYNWKNILSDQSTKSNELCNEGNYTYDKNINPFRHLGYLEYGMNNYSVNNKLTENIKYLACSFPSLIVDHYEYEYNAEGYPVVLTTFYKMPGNKFAKSVTFYEYY